MYYNEEDYKEEQNKLLSEKKKEAEKIKEEEKIARASYKKCYDVKVEVMTPIEVIYRVWATDEREAAKMVKERKALPRFVGKPKRLDNIINIAVYMAGTVNKLFSQRLKFL